MSTLKKNFLFNAVLSISALITPLITFPYISRVLGPERIGLINFSNSFVQYFILIAALGTPIYGIREIARNRENKIIMSKILLEIILLRVVTTLIVLLPYLISIFYIERCKNDIIFFILGTLSIIIGSLDITWFFSGIEDFKYITVRTLFFQALQIISILLFVRSREDAIIYFLLPIVLLLLNSIVNINFARKFTDFSFPFKTLRIKRHIKPVVILFFSTAAMSLYLFLDSVILGLLTKNENVGYYTTALKIIKLPNTFISILIPVLIPRVSSLITQNKWEEVQSIAEKTLVFILIMSIHFFIGIMALSNELIIVIAGHGFEPAITTIRILAPIIFFSNLAYFYCMQILLPLGKDKSLLTALLIGGVFSIIFNFLLATRYFENGTAIATVISEFTVAFLAYRFSVNDIKLKIPFGILGLNLLFAISYFLIATGTRSIVSSPIAVLIISLIIAAIFFIITQVFVLKNTIIVETISIFFNKNFWKMGKTNSLDND